MTAVPSCLFEYSSEFTPSHTMFVQEPYGLRSSYETRRRFPLVGLTDSTACVVITPCPADVQWLGVIPLVAVRPSCLLSWRRNRAELLQQTKGVHVEPMLDTLAAREAVDIDCRDRRLLAGRGDAHKRTLLCPTTGQAGPNLVPFSDYVLNREVQIRESHQIHVESLFDSLETSWRTRRGSVIDMIGVDEFVDGGPILLVEHFIVETAYAGLVYIG